MHVLVIDDLRVFRFPATYARTSTHGLRMLNQAWDEIWLDHDLGGDDTIMPVVDEMCRRAFEDAPVAAHRVFVHTSNPGAGDAMVRTLQRYGYSVKRVNASDYQ